MAHRKFVDLPLKMVIFHSYVRLPEGNLLLTNNLFFISYMVMTLCRTEKVDFSKTLKNKNRNKNRITKKTNRQEETEKKQEKNKKNKKTKKNKTAENAGFDFFCFFFLFFPWFWFSSLFFLFALVLFFFVFIFFVKPYILCVVGLIILNCFMFCLYRYFRATWILNMCGWFPHFIDVQSLLPSSTYEKLGFPHWKEPSTKTYLR